MDNDVLQQKTGTPNLLAGVAAAAQALLTCADQDQGLARALEAVGSALDVDRICVLGAAPGSPGKGLMGRRICEWTRGGPAAGPAFPQDIPLQESLPRWSAVLSGAEAIAGHVRDLPQAERSFLEPLGVKSLLVMPVPNPGRAPGLLCLFQCRAERAWPPEDKPALQGFAACLGGAMSRRDSEQALRASERQLRAIVDKLPVGVWLTDAGGRIILCNQAGEGVWGRSRPMSIEQCGQFSGWWHGTGRRIAPHEWAPVRALSRGETYFNEVVDIETADGQRRTVSLSAIPIRDDSSRITGIVVINEDITERTRAQARLRESEERHRRITQALSDYVYTVRVQDGRAVSTEHGAACEAVTGYTSDDFYANPYLWLRMVVEEDRAAVLEQGRRILSGAPTGPIEHRIIRKDNQVRWVRNTPVPHCDAQGRLLYYDGVIQDITDRRQAEDSLRLAQFAMDHCAIPVFWIGPSGRFLYVNEAAAQSLGYPREQLLYLGEPDVDPDLPVERWGAHWKELKERGILRWEGRRRTQAGRVFPVEITANYLEFKGQEYDFAFVRDISEQRQAQEKARESEAKYRVIADNTYDWEFWSGPGGEFRYVSPSCQRITGHAPEEFLTDPALFTRLIHPDDRERFSGHGKQALAGGQPGEIEFRIARADGALRWISHVCQPVYDGEGKFMGTRGSNRDITARKSAEESLRFTQFAVDNCSTPAYWVDGESRILYANDAACKVLGYAREELLRMKVFDVDPKLTPEAWGRFWAEVRERRSLVMESCQRAKDGRVFPTEVACSYLDHAGTQRCFAFVQDITLRKRSEEAQGS